MIELKEASLHDGFEKKEIVLTFSDGYNVAGVVNNMATKAEIAHILYKMAGTLMRKSKEEINYKL